MVQITPANTGSMPIRIWDLADGSEKSLTNKQEALYRNSTEKLGKEINDAFKFAKESLPPNQASAYTQVYSDYK